MIQVLDECLRAASGFKGTELTDGLEECGSLDIQILSDFRRRIRVSSAPSYDLNGLEAFKCSMEGHLSGSNLWSEVIMKHLPLALSHSSSMVSQFFFTILKLCLVGELDCVSKGIFSKISSV